MAANVLVDAGFLAALLRQRDSHRTWAAAQAAQYRPPWHCCEAVLSEAFHLLGVPSTPALSALLQRRSLVLSFSLADHREPVLALMHRYAEVPMSLADACLVRMTELLTDPVLLTTDADFRIYRRHGRQVIPSVLPR
jgi:predicted nucleic acid-binding protein